MHIGLALALVWLRVNFHAHAATALVEDDGTESPAELHRAMRAAGFDVSIWTPHGNPNRTDQVAGYGQLRVDASKMAVPGLTLAVGQELTVASGPAWSRYTMVLGRHAPGNLEHLTLVGNRGLEPFRELTPAAACDRVHADGGICIVNHPGPGPMMWEEGWWEAPQNRGHLDGLEVYNGQALSAVGIDFESRYREATAYRGLGVKLAATTGADTHGPKSVANTQAKLAGMAGRGIGKLARLMMPSSESARPELDAATLVQADGRAIDDVIAAVKARRTIATYAMSDLGVQVDGLGEVRRMSKVALAMKLSRKVAEVTLYREGVAVQTWHDADAVEWHETIHTPAAYVFAARDGNGRMMTSAIWYEPEGTRNRAAP